MTNNSFGNEVECPHCDGTRVSDYNQYDVPIDCEYCGGSGTIVTDLPHENPCPTCDGIGEIFSTPDVYEACSACNGSGEAASSKNEGIQFGKFMDKILVSEGYGVVRHKQEDNPLRLRAARHQDRPANRTVIGPRK